MATDEQTRLQIGHVLFIDIVGYSKLLDEEQKERLTEIVLATTPVCEATDEQLVRLPIGDGMALVFRRSAEEPARCALEIAEALRKHPELPVRMGIHSGPVSEVTDVSGRTNIAGAGINMAQRVMDCGDAGHILLSQHVEENADDAGNQVAQVYALRKEPEKMFEWLEHAWTTHDGGVTELLSDPFLRAYRDDPRFIALAQKVGVMPKAVAKP